MNTRLMPKTLLLSTAIGLLMLPGTQAFADTGEAAAEARGTVVEELIVTAQKREESALQVPMGLTAITGDDLVTEQSYRLEDFAGKVPGLNLTQTQGTQLVVRGIASTAASINAPVATYIDDTPLVGVGAFSGGFANTPNLDTFDLNRVEVLKGPQGTLYGANALGGLLKYVTNAPDPSGFEAKVQAGASTAAHGDAGYALHGMINIPMSDQLAFRAVAYANQYPGTIDDPVRGVEDIDEMRVYGGRASLLWKPTGNLSIRLNFLDHERRWDGMSIEDVALNTLTPIYCERCQVRDVDQPGESTLRLYNATVDWDFGPVKLTSSTTYDEWRFRQFQNLVALGFLADALKGVPGSGLWGIQVDFDYSGNDFVHETRLASDGDGMWNWQVGVYYTNKDASQNQTYLPINRTTHTIESVEFGGSFQPTTYEEVAAFGNVGIQFSPQFDVSVGGRYSDQNQTFEQIGRLVSPSLPFATMEDSVFTYSADARWRFTPDTMLYARVASGFVPGGPNVAPLNAPVPPTYGSSTTTNYEVGFKGALLDKRLTVELAAFQIDWEDIQLYRTFGIYTALANGGTAVSRGFEWAFNYVPIDGLTLGFNGAYTDAHLTENTPPGTGGFEGDRLPGSVRWQTAVSADYRWPMFGVTGFVGADWRYSGDRFADFTAATRQHMDSYNIVDLRAGVEAERWTVSVYAKNVGDTYAVGYVFPETGSVTQQRAFLINPRILGVEFSANF